MNIDTSKTNQVNSEPCPGCGEKRHSPHITCGWGLARVPAMSLDTSNTAANTIRTILGEDALELIGAHDFASEGGDTDQLAALEFSVRGSARVTRIRIEMEEGGFYMGFWKRLSRVSDFGGLDADELLDVIDEQLGPQS